MEESPMSTYCLAEKMKRLEALGINLSVYDNKEGILMPREDGFFVHESFENRFSVILKIPIRPDVAVVLASSGKEKKLTRLANFSSDGHYLTVRNISTHMTGFGSTTKPPDNSFKVISTADGILRVFEIGIATRSYEDMGCLHFLTVQEVYTGQLHFDEALQKVMVPAEEFAGYQNWLSLRELVAEMVDKDSLPRSVTPAPKPLPPVVGSNRGRVLFFNASTGLGLVKLAGDQIAGLHWTKINLDVPFPYVETGEEVEFSTSYTEKGFLKIADVKPA